MAENRKPRKGKNEPEVVEKRLRAVRLRLAGATYEQIARKVGYANQGTAYKAVQAALKQSIREPSDELRIIEAQRLERLQRVLWPRILRSTDLDCLDRLLKIMDRRAKLLGLDAPPKAPIASHEPDPPPDDAPRDPDGNQVPV